MDALPPDDPGQRSGAAAGAAGFQGDVTASHGDRSDGARHEARMRVTAAPAAAGQRPLPRRRLPRATPAAASGQQLPPTGKPIKPRQAEEAEEGPAGSARRRLSTQTAPATPAPAATNSSAASLAPKTIDRLKPNDRAANPDTTEG